MNYVKNHCTKIFLHIKYKGLESKENDIRNKIDVLTFIPVLVIKVTD